MSSTPLARPLRQSGTARLYRTISLLLVAMIALFGGCVSHTESLSVSASGTIAHRGTTYTLSKLPAAAWAEVAMYAEADRSVRDALAARGLHEAPAGAVPDIVFDFEVGVMLASYQAKDLQVPMVVVEQRELSTQRDPATADLRGTPQERQTYTSTKLEMRTYDKYLHLTAYPSTAPTERWSVMAKSSGESEDLRDQLPRLVAAASDRFAQDFSAVKAVGL